MKDLRVAVIPVNSGNGIDQSSDFAAIYKACMTRGDCFMLPLTDYFQKNNDEELPVHWSFLLDIEKRIDLTGTNIDGIHQKLIPSNFAEGREIGDANLQLRSGMEVIESDGNVGVVYQVYSNNKVSLCLEGYEGRGDDDMCERDTLIPIENLRLPKV